MLKFWLVWLERTWNISIERFLFQCYKYGILRLYLKLPIFIIQKFTFLYNNTLTVTINTRNAIFPKILLNFHIFHKREIRTEGFLPEGRKLLSFQRKVVWVFLVTERRIFIILSEFFFLFSRFGQVLLQKFSPRDWFRVYESPVGRPWKIVM